MGFKPRIFGEALILCVLLILDARNIVNGCHLFRPDGTEINLNAPFITAGLKEISDNEPPGLLSTFRIVDVTSVVPDPGKESKYLEYDFNDTALNILLSESYKDWKMNEDETFTDLSVTLKLDCAPTPVEFRSKINTATLTNRYPPEFSNSNYKIELPMPLPAGYAIFGECGKTIEVTDDDYHNEYKSDVTVSLQEATEDLEVTASKSDGKKWAVTLKTKSTFRIEKSLTVTLVAQDVPPADHPGDPVRTSAVTITIEPNITASTPAPPLFKEPIYILDIKGEEDIIPVEATLVEGFTVPYEVELEYSHGEDLTGFFEIKSDGALITLTPSESLVSTEFSDNFGVLILKAKQTDTNQIGKTVIHVTLPGNYVTPPPSTTETTILPCSCPTEETTYTTDTTPTEEITQCPEVTCLTEVTCPTEVACSTEVTCPTELTCPTEVSCPDVTGTTETTILPCSCPPEETTCTTDTTTPTEDITQCPEVTCPNVTGTTESCVCTTEHTSLPGTTNTVDTNTCEPCDCTPGTPESSTAPPLDTSIYFTDPKAIVYIYEQQMGYIKTMSAYCISECKIKYEIEPGSLDNNLIIDPETGDINITESIKESNFFYVKAIAEIDGRDYEERATVHLSVMTLQPCQNGSDWNNTLTVTYVQEEFESPYVMEKCDYVDGCECSIAKVIPEKARGYFIDGREIVLNKTIDREDMELFPDQSNTYIILHLEVSCEIGEKTVYEFWDGRSRSAIDDIGTIKCDPSRTVTVLQIEDINDNRPEFDVTSLTVGYPSAEIANQLLPPYLMKVQATDADFGENAIIKYSLMPDDQFFIHQDTGVIYPVAEAFIYENTHFKVYASDSEGAGEPLEVNVKILSSDNLLVIKRRGSVLEDVNAVIDEISTISSYNIKLISAAVIASDDTAVSDAVNKQGDDRQLPNFNSMNEPSNSLLRLIIYGLDPEEKPVSYSDIQKDLEGATNFTSESWADSNSCTDFTSESSTTNESTDTGLLIAVIVLAVIILLLLGGAGVAYLYYVRSRRNSDDEYYEKIINSGGSSSRFSTSEVNENAEPHAVEAKNNYANEQHSIKTEVIQPSAPLSTTTTKPDQEVVNIIKPNEFNQGTTDVKNTADNGDGGEHQDKNNFENIANRRKSLVTFNDNIERIEIEEL